MELIVWPEIFNYPLPPTPPRIYSLFRFTLRLKDICSLLMSFWTMSSKQWTPAEVKVWFSRRVFSYSMVSVQLPLGSGKHFGRKCQHTHMGGLKSSTLISSVSLWEDVVAPTVTHLPSTWKARLESCDTSKSDGPFSSMFLMASKNVFLKVLSFLIQHSGTKLQILKHSD